ncbi:MAG: tryptophan--tRNA ligase [Candidatus Microsaccharimonas sossegonensis]|uniref:Tryptophan--tRNA ligase n=1 Tax=Candidatus Microsaccharimonas sossegonensis TaxID=2506948 RepID=A0A4Q0AIA3_9BACT|nr:MAG: tryptophan--tRNA ligase [Candidatus Microsaccharimonas sossegonensis]
MGSFLSITVLIIVKWAIIKQMAKPIILTGLRANNNLTIGNYFGAILPIIDMAHTRSKDYQINMFIPDLHSITTTVDHSAIYKQILLTAKQFVAAGLPLNNPDIHVYRQSYIPAHSELTWILDCFTGMGEMSRMTQYKDKSGTIGDERVSVGLFNYPVLMAADILLYSPTYVPVGDDQSQHLEFTRDIGERFNKNFGDIFILPKSVKEQHEFFGKEQGLRIKDLQDPTKKMSKSDESGKGVIFLSDTPEAAARKVMSAVTDKEAYVRFDRKKQPGVSNLLEILALLQGRPLSSVVAEFEGQTRYGDFKAVVAEETRRFLTDFQKKLHEVDEDAVLKKLQASEKKLSVVAQATLLRAQQAVGLRPGQ